ncbi:MAG: MetQ/NlpA family ABC transporter substrate-binding protein [Peptidiphaga gingivicola]
MSRFKSFAALAAVSALALSACGADDKASFKAPKKNSDGTVTITVGASPVPHAQILNYVQDNLAKKAGLKVEIKQYQDYIQPNSALDQGEIDANFFQHVPYLKDASKKNGYSFEHGKGVHIEPLGIYSKKIKDLKDLPDNATVAINDDPSNQARALELLVKNKIITLKKKDSPTIYDVESNPKKIQLKPYAAPSIPAALPDVDIAIINGNYALKNKLTPSKDALYLESGKDNPYANVLVWNSKANGKTIEAVKKLDKLLHSKEVSDYIKKTWPDGAVSPSF